MDPFDVEDWAMPASTTTELAEHDLESVLLLIAGFVGFAVFTAAWLQFFKWCLATCWPTEPPVNVLVGILGRANAGKSTTAKIMEAEFGACVVSNSGLLKDIVAAGFSWPRHLLTGDTEESRAWRERTNRWSSILDIPELTPRYVLQQWGTNLVRNHFHQDFWVKALMNQIDQGIYGPHVVVEDVRFPNEAQAIHERGGLLIRVERGEKPHWQTALENGADPNDLADILPHESEWAGVGMEDVVLQNDGTLAELRENVCQIVRDFMQERMNAEAELRAHAHTD